MGVYIKGMKMPKSCDVCCFDLFVESCPLYNATPEDLVGITWIKKARHRYCPLVPVPPHGRLIDADALIEKCEEMADKEDGNQLDALVLLRWFLEQNAPTVIPAEEGET